MPGTYCIICGKRRNGLEIEEDFVIDFIRWFKRNVTRNEQGNRLVVCKEDYERYSKLRRKAVSKRNFYVGLGVIFAIMVFIALPSLSAILIAILIIGLLYGLSLLSYMPKLKIQRKEKK